MKRSNKASFFAERSKALQASEDVILKLKCLNDNLLMQAKEDQECMIFHYLVIELQDMRIRDLENQLKNRSDSVQQAGEMRRLSKSYLHIEQELIDTENQLQSLQNKLQAYYLSPEELTVFLNATFEYYSSQGNQQLKEFIRSQYCNGVLTPTFPLLEINTEILKVLQQSNYLQRDLDDERRHLKSIIDLPSYNPVCKLIDKISLRMLGKLTVYRERSQPTELVLPLLQELKQLIK